MKGLGISVYPQQNGLAETLAYIELAARFGFKQIFTCLISAADKNLAEVTAEFRQITALAKKHGMEVTADIAPEIFTAFQASHTNLAVFQELGLSGVRLDMGFGGIEEAIMTCNPYGLKIGLNMSNGTRYVDNVVSHRPNRENLVGCHNFYPHVYTGLSYEHFIACSRQFKELDLRTAAFVNAQSASCGPWPVSEGLCTLESHRKLPIEVQAKQLFATGLIDDVIIANACASEDELRRLSQVNRNMLEFSLRFAETASALERKIVLEELHFNRGDVSEYMVRSTQSRVKYKNESFPAVNTPDIIRGDVLIESSLYSRYAGELQIALRPMKNSGRTNVVASIVPEEVFLVDYLEPWMKFSFVEAK